MFYVKQFKLTGRESIILTLPLNDNILHTGIFHLLPLM